MHTPPKSALTRSYHPGIRRTLLLVLALALVNILAVPWSYAASTVLFKPSRISLSANEISNPGRGLYTWLGQTYITPASMISNKDSYRRFRWSQIETSQGVYDWSRVRSFIDEAEQSGQRAIVGLTQSSGPPNTDAWAPTYLVHSGYGESFKGTWFLNYNNSFVRGRLEALLDSFMQNFGDDQRIYAIQLLAYGQYGEGYIPWDAPTTSSMRMTDASSEWMLNAYYARFIDRFRLLVPLSNIHLFTYAMTRDNRIGWVRMALGWPSQMANIDRLMADNSVGSLVRERWKTAPVMTEMIGDYGTRDYSNQFRDALAEVSQYHISYVSNGNFHAPYGEPRPFTAGGQRNNASTWTDQNVTDFVMAGKRAGYRYAIESMSLAPLTAGMPLAVTIAWENDGVAPIYERWPVHIQLRDAQDDVAFDTISAIDLRTVLPTNGTPIIQNDTFTLPASLRSGTYRVHVVIPALNRYVPTLQLAINGKQSDGSYYLGTVAVASGNGVVATALPSSTKIPASLPTLTPLRTPIPDPTEPSQVPTLTPSPSAQVPTAPPAPSTGDIEFHGQFTHGVVKRSSITFSKPNGVQPGDVLLAQVVGRKPTLTLTAPSGWTLIRQDVSPYTLDQNLYYHIAGANEPSSYTWKYNGQTDIGGGIVAYGGVDNNNPIDTAGGRANSASSNVTAPSITTHTDHAQLVFFGSMAWSKASWKPASFLTQRYVLKATDVQVSATVVDQVWTSAGATGTITVRSSGSNNNVGQVVALRPAQ